MKVRYLGPSFGADGLVDQGIYTVLEVDPLLGALRLIDESGEDYLYSPTAPGPFMGAYPGGRFEVVEDSPDEILKQAIFGK